jgi:hypothetical protein
MGGNCSRATPPGSPAMVENAAWFRAQVVNIFNIVNP